MKQILLAIQFLTIIPVRVGGTCTQMELAGSTSFFPLAGALQGVLMALTAAAALKLFPVEVASVLVIAALMLSNGGFDMDGLMDTFDALAVKATGDDYRDREKRLAAMKDSAVGATGAMALAMTLLLKYTLITHLLRSFPLAVSLCALFIIPVFSKWINVPAMYHGVSARKDGLGQLFIEAIKAGNVVAASLCLLVLYLGAEQFLKAGFPAMQTIMLFSGLFLSLYLLALLAAWYTRKKFGGLTGDCFGALSEITEILLLLAVPIWLQPST
jgi:adenosylcobinamide-GDP ribazoletransferase